MKSKTWKNLNIQNVFNLKSSPFKNSFAGIFALLVLFAFEGCSQPEPNWLKGNLHTHTFWSDGDEFPESVAQWYKENGYNFLALTDHNVILEGERWRNFPEDHATLHKYLETYGEEWVEMHSHEEEEGVKRVRLKTLEEFRSMYEEPEKFLLIMGNEITNPHAVHLLAFHQNRVVPAVQGTVDERKRMIHETVENVTAYREETGINAHAALAHPNFTWAITAEMMLNVPNLRYFEVFNGHPMVNNTGDEIRAGTDRIWDIVLANRLESVKGELLYGLATDDAHNYHGSGAGPGRGWVMVSSEELSPETILDAIDKGDFYASTGVELKNIQFKGKSLFHVYDNLDGVKTMPMHFAEQGYETFGTGNGTTECSRPATPPHADLTIFTVFARDTGQKEPVHAANDSDLISKENYSIWKTTPDNMKMFLKNSRRFQITCYKHKNIGKIHK